MVVDDEPDNLDLLYRTFRRTFKVFRANGATEALELLEEQGEMSVIISDQRMPVMNGTELLSRTVDRFPETIRILLTGYTDVEDLVEAINSGQVFKYITKPWQPDDLKRVVEQAADTYLVLKKRTNELRKSLRREELLNLISRAMRESLDYDQTLQSIVDSIGEHFGASSGFIQALEGKNLGKKLFTYGLGPAADSGDPSPPEAPLQTQITQAIATQEPYFHHTPAIATIIVPLLFQNQTLAILVLQQINPQNPWQEEDLQLLSLVTEPAGIAISQAQLYHRIQRQAEKMGRELEVARQIQHNLLPQPLPPLDQVKVEGICYPAQAVGGDFYELFRRSPDEIWFALGDVSGKGVPAALFMASALSILRRELALDPNPEPAQLMANLNQAMADDLFSNNCFITMVIACYCPSRQELTYANAGHIYPLLWNQNALADSAPEPQFLKTRSVPVGILPQWRGQSATLHLTSGDIFLLTSDGFTEATVASDPDLAIATHNGMLNQGGLWALIRDMGGPFQLHQLLDRFYHCTTATQEDDQTLVFLEVR